MLDFLLVLGQIPGTNVQISFWQLVFGAFIIWVTVRLWRRPNLRRKYIYWLQLVSFYIYFRYRLLRQR